MGVTVRRVQKLWARYKYTEPNQLVYPKPMSQPKKSHPGRLEYSAVLSTRQRTYLGTTRLKGKIQSTIVADISYRITFQVLRAADISKQQPKKSKRRKWILVFNRHAYYTMIKPVLII